MSMETPHAVLTGDLVKSEDLTRERLDHVRQCLMDAARDMKHWDQDLSIGDPDFFQGDAWQMSLSTSKWALRAMIFMWTSLLAQDLADTRVAVGIGTEEFVAEGRTSLSAAGWHGIRAVIEQFERSDWKEYLQPIDEAIL